MNRLTVPKKGTERAGTPLSNMIHPEPVASDLSDKKRTSINLDRDIYTKFKIYCITHGKSVSGLMEKAMRDIMDGKMKET